MQENGLVFFGANVFDNGTLRIEPCYREVDGKREYYFQVANKKTGSIVYSKANANQTKRIEDWLAKRAAA